MNHIICIVCVVAIAISQQLNCEATEDVGKLGHMCTLGVYPEPDQSIDAYLACLKPTEDANDWPWEQVGVWTLKTCASGKLFSVEDRMCRNERSVRRQQQAYCSQFPSSCGFSQPQSSCGPPPAPPCQPQPAPVPYVHEPIPYVPQPAPYVPQPSTFVSQSCGPPPAPPCQSFEPQQIVQPQTYEPYVDSQSSYEPYVEQGSFQSVYPSSACGPPPAPPCQPQVHQPSCGPPPAPPCQPTPIYPQPAQSCGPPPAPPCQPAPIPQPVCGPPPMPSCQPVCGRPQQPACPPVKKPCPLAGSGMCSWMLEKLRGAGQGYQQCVPSTNRRSPYCGQWIRRPCARGTRFDARLQVCIADPRAVQSTCAPQTIPIGPCNAQSQCPGQSMCQRSTCCQPYSG